LVAALKTWQSWIEESTATADMTEVVSEAVYDAVIGMRRLQVILEAPGAELTLDKGMVQAVGRLEESKQGGNSIRSKIMDLVTESEDYLLPAWNEWKKHSGSYCATRTTSSAHSTSW